LPEQRRKWDLRYLEADYHGLRPCCALSDNSHLLPERGRALDLAAGLGVNALFLAKQGLDTAAWDLSSRALDHLVTEARQRGLSIDVEARDLTDSPPSANSFDVIVVSHFLERSLCPVIEEALMPGGLLFYQTWTAEKSCSDGPTNPDFLLGEGELLELFPNLIARVYREEGRVGDLEKGVRNQAMLVGQKRC